MGIKYIIEGKEHLPTEGSYIIVANHQTPLDFLGTLGLAGWLAGMIFIERKFSHYTKKSA